MSMMAFRGILFPPGCVAGWLCLCCVVVSVFCVGAVCVLLCWLVCLVVCVCVCVCVCVGLLVWLGVLVGFLAASPPSAPIDWGDRLGLKLWVGLGGVCGWLGLVVVVVVAVVVCASCFRPPSPDVYLVACEEMG